MVTNYDFHHDYILWLHHVSIFINHAGVTGWMADVQSAVCGQV